VNTSWSGDRVGFPTAVRRFILARDPVCVWCRVRRSVIADHIVNVAMARRAGWPRKMIDDPANGQGMCRECHDVKTKAEQERGRQLRSRKRLREKHPGLI